MKRNSTATAPIYTISIIIAINSAPKRMNNREEKINVTIKNNTECMGFFALITQVADKVMKIEKRKKKKDTYCLTIVIVIIKVTITIKSTLY